MRHCQRGGYMVSIYAICFLLSGISSAEDTVREQNSAAFKASIEPEGRALFNPRVDYNQWMPVGHSDPLKNDPTFDYVPPTSGSVRYWSESDEKTNENRTSTGSSEKNEILLLGVPVEHTVQSNHLSQPEVKSSNRRSSPYYPPEPSRMLTPPPMQTYASYQDQNGFPSDYNYYATHANYWGNDLPAPHASDVYPEESAAYVTVIRPKTNPHPYSSTIYNKNTRNTIYHLAANVNSLEPVDRRPHWVHSLLQKEITYQPEMTTPQVVVAYHPHIYKPKSPSLIHDSEALPSATPDMADISFAEPTTPTPMTSTTTDAMYSRYPVIPERSPMFLIIQGHSKVKTYGPDGGSGKNADKHEAKMVPVTVHDDPIVKHVVALDTNGNEIQVKHLHKVHTPEPKPKTTSTKTNKKGANSAMDSLLSLLDSSLANFASLPDKQTKTKTNELKKTNERTTISSTKLSTILGPTTIRSLDSQFES